MYVYSRERVCLLTYFIALDVLKHMIVVDFPTKGLFLVVAMGTPKCTVHLKIGDEMCR